MKLSSFTLKDSKAVYNLSNLNPSTKLSLKVKDALNVIDNALLKYGLHGLSLSFNGGKDCTVLLHLLAASIYNSLPPPPSSLPSTSSSFTPTAQPPQQKIKIQAVYVRDPNPFQEVEDFVDFSKEVYGLELERVEGGMKVGLGNYLILKSSSFSSTSSSSSASSSSSNQVEDRKKQEDSKKEELESQIKAILVGTRRTDPHGLSLHPFEMTDNDWPRFMRVHPILDWNYGEIWEFLRCEKLTLGDGADVCQEESEEVEGEERKEMGGIREGEGGEEGRIRWCCLYDRGYTSLGSIHNTFLNPLLRLTPPSLSLSSLPSSNNSSVNTTSILIKEVETPDDLLNKTEEKILYAPAWELKDDTQERAGRGTS